MHLVGYFYSCITMHGFMNVSFMLFYDNRYGVNPVVSYGQTCRRSGLRAGQLRRATFLIQG